MLSKAIYIPTYNKVKHHVLYFIPILLHLYMGYTFCLRMLIRKIGLHTCRKGIVRMCNMLWYLNTYSC